VAVVVDVVAIGEDVAGTGRMIWGHHVVSIRSLQVVRAVKGEGVVEEGEGLVVVDLVRVGADLVRVGADLVRAGVDVVVVEVDAARAAPRRKVLESVREDCVERGRVIS